MLTTFKNENYVPLCGDLQAVLFVADCLLVFCTGNWFDFSFFVSLEQQGGKPPKQRSARKDTRSEKQKTIAEAAAQKTNKAHKHFCIIFLVKCKALMP